MKMLASVCEIKKTLCYNESVSNYNKWRPIYEVEIRKFIQGFSRMGTRL